MATANDIYGQIGAAKAFNTSVTSSLKLDTDNTAKKIEELESRLNDATLSDSERKSIEKQLKRLRRRNKLNSLQSKLSQGATDFLTKICSYMDIGIAVIINWISKIIVAILPALEVSVKMLLLTNIKKMVGCSIDPRIPDEWRYPGVLLNEAMIDPRRILESSPYSKWGKYNYFDVFYDDDKTDGRPTFELARAEDMNAFLWFAKNCAKIASPNIVGDDLSVYFDVTPGTTFSNTHVFKGRNDHKYVEGATFKTHSESNTIYLCVKRVFILRDVYYTIVPAYTTSASSEIRPCVNWYKDRTSITGLEKRKEIDYNKSKPLFNIEYLSGYVENSLYPDGNFMFRILPKPFSTGGGFIVDLKNNINTLSDMVNSDVTEVVGSQITNGMPQYQFQGIQSPIPHTARFTRDGVYDKRGRYSIDMVKYAVSEGDNNNDNVYYSIRTSPNSSEEVACLRFEKATKTFYLEKKNSDNDTYEPLDKATMSSVLTECYTGNTVYEFNYDYVVSMKLFDAKSIATGIVDSLMNINIPNIFKRSKDEEPNVGGNTISNTDQISIDAYVDKLVEKMIDNEEREFTDCFYSFSNEDYEAMEQEVADKVINSSLVTDASTDSIQGIYDTIDLYDADATLNEKVETISLALTKAANACGFTEISGVPAGDTGYAASVGDGNSISNFITQAIKFLTSAIVNAILTPKVLMLMQVNRMMMGTYAMPPSKIGDLNKYVYNVEELLNGLTGLLKGIIQEIINMIQKELLRLILERLSEMMAAYIKRLGIEYAMKWVLLLKQLISCFKINKNNMDANRLYNSQYNDMINNIIDRVDYADIDTLVDEIMPNTNNC